MKVEFPLPKLSVDSLLSLSLSLEMMMNALSLSLSRRVVPYYLITPLIHIYSYFGCFWLGLRAVLIFMMWSKYIKYSS